MDRDDDLAFQWHPVGSGCLVAKPSSISPSFSVASQHDQQFDETQFGPCVRQSRTGMGS
jgi:hypothetical protein